jgi:hypothetical protein
MVYACAHSEWRENGKELIVLGKQGLVVLLSLAAATTSAAADPAVRPGLWEVKLVRQYMDGRDVTVLVPAALAGMTAFMDNMTPEQRKQMQATFGRPPTSTTQRICISPEMAAGDKPLLPPEVNCEPTRFERAGNRIVFEFNCADKNRSSSGKGESILASENVATRIDLVTSDANGRHTWRNETQATYVGAECGNLKPADRVVRDPQATGK